MELTIGTYNLFDFGRDRGDEAQRRYKQVADIIREMNVDVLAVQEVCGAGRGNLEWLAEASDLSCWYQPPWVSEEDADMGRVAIASTWPRLSDYHVGLLWNDTRVRARHDGFRGYDGGGEFWHAMALQTFEIPGFDRPLHVGSYHGPPFAMDNRPDEARRVQAALTRPGADRLAIVGADWNSVSADRVQDSDGSWRWWHPDPYWSDDASNTWIEPYGYQCQVFERGGDGRPTSWRADRRPGQVLADAGCRDTAALAGAPWAPTVGHHPDDDLGHRTIDTHRVSPALAPAVAGWEVIDTDATRAASDHLPAVTTLDLARLAVT